jgi:phage terminase small subunit
MPRKALSAWKTARREKRRGREAAETGTLVDDQNRKLSAKEEQFVLEYLKDLNGRRAYQETYPNCKSELAARACASRLLTKANVGAAIRAQREAMLEELQIERSRILRELRDIAQANMGDFARWGPDGVFLTDSEKLTRSQQGCVSEASEETHERTDSEGNLITRRSVRFRLHDKLSALNMLARHLGVYATNGHGVNVNAAGPVQFNFVIGEPE